MGRSQGPARSGQGGACVRVCLSVRLWCVGAGVGGTEGAGGGSVASGQGRAAGTTPVPAEGKRNHPSKVPCHLHDDFSHTTRPGLGEPGSSTGLRLPGPHEGVPRLAPPPGPCLCSSVAQGRVRAVGSHGLAHSSGVQLPEDSQYLSGARGKLRLLGSGSADHSHPPWSLPWEPRPLLSTCSTGQGAPSPQSWPGATGLPRVPRRSLPAPTPFWGLTCLLPQGWRAGGRPGARRG